MARWAVQFRGYDLSLCPRSPPLGGRALHPQHAGAPSLSISLSVGVQLRLLLLWKSGQIDQSYSFRPTLNHYLIINILVGYLLIDIVTFMNDTQPTLPTLPDTGVRYSPRYVKHTRSTGHSRWTRGARDTWDSIAGCNRGTRAPCSSRRHRQRSKLRWGWPRCREMGFRRWPSICEVRQWDRNTTTRTPPCSLTTGLFSTFRVRTAKLQIINYRAGIQGTLLTLECSGYLDET